MFGIDVQCECGHVRYVLLQNREAKPDAEDAKCPNCGSEHFERCVGGNFATFASGDLATRQAMLKKRSEDHSRATFKDNYERVRSKILR